MMLLNNIEETSEVSVETTEEKTVSVPKEKKVRKSGGELQTLSFKLMIIIAAVVLMLAVVNGLTKDKIAENAKKANDEARIALFADATAFDPISLELTEDLTKYIGEVYEATKDGETLGYCVNVISNGFGGEISMIVGISGDGLITGVKVVNHTETAGVGERIISNGSILSQFVNASANSITSVSTITGATVTSKAIIDGVQKALSAVAELTQGGY
ncbi:MAG: FMN-binding protein [Clostridia bacterium]|nr:FMN-binding protein [Clostridia bacterium]